ncbi:hypothetical protein QAD02_020466 [Eretmocerus hayati]|uniref:Uncharacterized protein n=1 Tax=Eretmocerus hayati TaxID=131215 RepID=A0ACC2PNP7_9HYME|nr:hypothetical protein QAD02_020466 [Eretmocerus hayati]
MFTCKKCNRKIVSKEVTCRECTNHFHLGCATIYVANKPADFCCVRSFRDILHGDRDSNATAFSSRDKVFNQSRNLDISVECVDESALNLSLRENPSGMANLPGNWDSLTTSQQLAALYSNVNSKSDQLDERMSDLTVKVEEFNATLS